MHVNIICNSSVQVKSDILDLKILAMCLIHFVHIAAKKCWTTDNVSVILCRNYTDSDFIPLQRNAKKKKLNV